MPECRHQWRSNGLCRLCNAQGPGGKGATLGGLQWNQFFAFRYRISQINWNLRFSTRAHSTPLKEAEHIVDCFALKCCKFWGFEIEGDPSSTQGPPKVLPLVGINVHRPITQDLTYNSYFNVIDCESVHTLGHYLRHYNEHCNVNCRLNAFVCRNINVWNRLPAHVMNSESVAVFKRRLACVNLVNFCFYGTY